MGHDGEKYQSPGQPKQEFGKRWFIVHWKPVTLTDYEGEIFFSIAINNAR